LFLRYLYKCAPTQKHHKTLFFYDENLTDDGVTVKRERQVNRNIIHIYLAVDDRRQEAGARLRIDANLKKKNKL